MIRFPQNLSPEKLGKQSPPSRVFESNPGGKGLRGEGSENGFIREAHSQGHGGSIRELATLDMFLSAYGILLLFLRFKPVHYVVRKFFCNGN